MYVYLLYIYPWQSAKALSLSQKVIARSLFAKTNDKQATYDNVYSMSMTDTNDERCKADTNEESIPDNQLPCYNCLSYPS
jgi:hypothetical protein